MCKATIAEFVEDTETLALLKRFGVDMVQRFYRDTARSDHPVVEKHIG
jgi:EAL domain-containing protein (putative c-di-GMP-specific phosphodiesterase class I)